MKRMLNDEQIFELQELLEQVSISSGVVDFNKMHLTELTISDNGKWDGSGIHITDLTKLLDNAETPQQLLPLSVANAGKVLAVGEDGESVDAVEVSGGTQLYKHTIIANDDEDNELPPIIIYSKRSSEYTSISQIENVIVPTQRLSNYDLLNLGGYNGTDISIYVNDSGNLGAWTMTAIISDTVVAL